jgi:uncharacterized short protein YbdD (DUF466 family)
LDLTGTSELGIGGATSQLEAGDMAMAIEMMRRVWDMAREVLGDNAYERYKARARQQGQKVLTAKEFYLSQLERKYSKPSRCC